MSESGDAFEILHLANPFIFQTRTLSREGKWLAECHTQQNTSIATSPSTDQAPCLLLFSMCTQGAKMIWSWLCWWINGGMKSLTPSAYCLLGFSKVFKCPNATQLQCHFSHEISRLLVRSSHSFLWTPPRFQPKLSIHPCLTMTNSLRWYLCPQLKMSASLRAEIRLWIATKPNF